jgi:SHS2 domain-containing protein
MQKQKIEILDHTADLAIRIHAETTEELFRLGAAAVYQLIGRPIPSEGGPKPYSLALKANTAEELFHDWLAEILFWFQVRQIIFESFDFAVLDAGHLKATAQGRKLDVENSEIHVEIKAVTYHNLHIERSADGLTATVIFDI